MTTDTVDIRRKYVVRYPDGLTADEGLALLEQARDALAASITLSSRGDETTIEGEQWHIIAVCLALPLFEMNEC